MWNDLDKKKLLMVEIILEWNDLDRKQRQWWCTPLNPALGRWRMEAGRFL